MKTSIFSLIVSVFCLWACSPSQQGDKETAGSQVSISGSIANANAKTVTVLHYTYPGMERETLAEVELDSTGAFSAVFDLSKPTEARFVHGKESAPVYLSPGDELTLSLNAEQFDETLTYEGKGAAPNNYLISKFLLDEQMEEALEGPAYLLPLEAFTQYADSAYNVRLAHLQDFFKSQKAPEGFMDLMKASLKSEAILDKTRYPMYHQYYAQLQEPLELPEDYHAYWDELPLDEQMLPAGAYRAALESYVESKLTKELYEESPKTMEEYQAQQEGVYFALGQQEQLSEGLSEYLQTHFLLNYMGMAGTDGVDSMYQHFGENVLNEGYVAKVEGMYNRWQQLAPGKPAPEIKLPNQAGEMVALSDFKGKVVYIDVWATWCGPCRGEIPHSKTLKKHYEGQEDVVFLYVSIDEDKKAWEDMLANDPEFKGVHIIDTKGWAADISKKYMIRGIPRYMLIDKNGNIADVDAPRPSSGEQLIAEIDKLRQEETVAMN